MKNQISPNKYARAIRKEIGKRSQTTKDAGKQGIFFIAAVLGSFFMAMPVNQMAHDLSTCGDHTLLGPTFLSLIYLVIGLGASWSVLKAIEHSKNEEALLEMLDEQKQRAETYHFLLLEKRADISTDDWESASEKANFFFQSRSEQVNDDAVSVEWLQTKEKLNPEQFMYKIHNDVDITLNDIERMLSASEGIGNKGKYPNAIWGPHRVALMKRKGRLQNAGKKLSM